MRDEAKPPYETLARHLEKEADRLVETVSQLLSFAAALRATRRFEKKEGRP